MGKTYRKHEARLMRTRELRKQTLKTTKQRRSNERAALRKEYR